MVQVTGVDKRTGKLIYDREFTPNMPFHTLQDRPARRARSNLVRQDLKIQLRMDDGPKRPRPRPRSRRPSQSRPPGVHADLDPALRVGTGTVVRLIVWGRSRTRGRVACHEAWHRLSGLCLAGLFPGLARADELPPKVREAVDKGLKWFADTQNRDGHWEANGGQYPTSMTALGRHGHAHGRQHLREGKYADNIRRAVDWLMDRAQPNGLIGNPNNPTEAGRYMYGHGFGMLFLASVYGEEEDGDRRKKLEEILTKGGRVHRQGPDQPRRLGLRLGGRRQQLRRRLGDDHPGAGPAGRPQRRHRRAEGDHRQGGQVPQGLDHRRAAA